MRDWLLSFLAAAAIVGLTIWTAKVVVEVLR